MTGITWPAWGLCVATGAALGLFFLLLKLVRLLLRGGRLCAALMDVLFCLVWAVVAFLCALAVDKGRLRFFQAAMQALGAWGAIVSLDPLLTGLARGLKKLHRGLRRLMGRFLLRPASKAARKLKNKLPKPRPKPKKRKKPGAKKKNRKNPLKNLWKLVYNGEVKTR